MPISSKTNAARVPVICQRLMKAALALLLMLMLIPAVSPAQTPPGAPFPNTSELSDQKPGSILFFNYYTSNFDAPQTRNTEFNLTNTHPNTAVSLHMFFVFSDFFGVSDTLFTLAPNQTIRFLASNVSPGDTGYAIAIAVNSATGCAINFNHLIGNAFIKLDSGHQANLPAVAVSAIANIPSACDNATASAALNFDGVNYNKLPRVEVMNSIASTQDGNNTLFILNRIGGNLNGQAATLGTMFGILYDDAENALSFSFTGSTQFVGTIDNAFPRTTPRVNTFIPAGRSGWMKVYNSLSDDAILGASLNFNSSANSDSKKYNNGQNFTHRALTEGSTTLTVPVFPVNCTFGISPMNASFPASGGSGSVTVTSNGCLWSANSNVPWISVEPTSVNIIGGTLGYQVAGNPSASPRTGTVTIGGQTFTVMQSGNCASITIAPASLPSGAVGAAYNQTLIASGGLSPYILTVSAGTLPNGLSLSAGGALTGAPTQAGVFNFTVQAADAGNCIGSMAYTVTINSGIVASGLQFYPLPAPVRLLETRAGFSGCTTTGDPISAGGTFTLPARTGCAGIPASAAAVTGNITVVPAGAGYLTLFPSDNGQPTVANSNFKAGEITNNVFTVGLGAGDGAFKIFSSATTEVIVDVTGYYAPPGSGGFYFHPLPTPVRLLETRTGQFGCIASGTKLTGTGDPNANPNLDLAVQGRSPVASPCNSIPASAQVLVGNATSVLPLGQGYLTIYPSGVSRPTVASSNYAGNDVINGPFTVKLGADGQFKVYTFATTDLVIDILGYYSEDASDANGTGLLFTTFARPVRLLETRPNFPGFPLPGCSRPNAPIQGGAAGTRTQSVWGTCDGVAIPNTARAIVGNATVLNPAAPGFLTFYPGNLANAPTVATSNYSLPGVFGYNRHYFVGLSPTDGTFKILTQFTTDLIVDVSGYFAP